MFKRILIVAWISLIAGTALLFLFPKTTVRVLSPTILLIFSVVTILGSVAYGLMVTYRRIANRSGSN
jgi:hypothetical protein